MLLKVFSMASKRKTDMSDLKDFRKVDDHYRHRIVVAEQEGDPAKAACLRLTQRMHRERNERRLRRNPRSKNLCREDE